MLKKSIFIILIATSMFGAYGLVKGPSYPPINKTATLYAAHDYRGKKAPKIEAQKWLTGPLPSLKGKVVLVDFFATWCAPCRETIPELGDWQKKFPKDLVVIGISDESESTVSDYMKAHPMPYNVGIDPQETMEKKVGVTGIPHVLVISPDGIVRWQGFPLNDQDTLTEAVVKQIIDASKAKS